MLLKYFVDFYLFNFCEEIKLLKCYVVIYFSFYQPRKYRISTLSFSFLFLAASVLECN